MNTTFMTYKEEADTLRDKLAAQATVIEMLRDALHITANNCQYLLEEAEDAIREMAKEMK